jgi:hypothetical protein
MTSGRRRSRLRPVAVGGLHGRLNAGNVRLSRMSRAGTVWTVDMETGEPHECDFAPESGTWLETEDGTRWALAAQAVGRDGSHGGAYLTVSRIEDDGGVPAVDPKAFGDAAGTPSGCELGGAIVIETFLSATNGSGAPLQHFCSLPVSTSTSPHPDGATLVGPSAGPVFTYIGRGAALNDIHGGEVGQNGRYLPLPGHVAISSGFEVIAAKRPAIRSFPAPIRIDPLSKLVWRTVVPQLRIGSPTSGDGCPP